MSCLLEAAPLEAEEEVAGVPNAESFTVIELL